MDVDELRARYRGLVVTACEWRAMELADPQDMAEDVFRRLTPRRDYTLRDLYAVIDRVVLGAYERSSDRISILDRLRTGVSAGNRERDDYLDALSSLREADRRLLQLRFWDDLDEGEAAEVLGLSVERVRERMARAGERYLKKLSRRHPELVLGDVLRVLEVTKPGRHRRFGDA